MHESGMQKTWFWKKTWFMIFFLCQIGDDVKIWRQCDCYLNQICEAKLTYMWLLKVIALLLSLQSGYRQTFLFFVSICNSTDKKRYNRIDCRSNNKILSWRFFAVFCNCKVTSTLKKKKMQANYLFYCFFFFCLLFHNKI